MAFSAISLLISCASSISMASVEVVSKGVLKALSLLALSILSSFSLLTSSQVFVLRGGGLLGYDLPFLRCMCSRSAMEIGSVTLYWVEVSCLIFFLSFSLTDISSFRAMVQSYINVINEQNYQ